ncbi:MAG: DUF2207 domain-containing protein [Actinomycetota bacterium]|nr:MAG: DUF2207 domain-containing protein [Actinomycetota bacterium]
MGAGRAHAVGRADIYAMLILLAGAVAYALVWLWRPRPFRPSDPGPPISDPDGVGVAPAVCGFLLRGCRQADADFTATLLDLIDRGVVEVSPQPGDRDDQLLTLHSGRLQTVWPHEDALLRLLFEVAGEHERSPCGGSTASPANGGASTSAVSTTSAARSPRRRSVCRASRSAPSRSR